MLTFSYEGLNVRKTFVNEKIKKSALIGSIEKTEVITKKITANVSTPIFVEVLKFNLDAGQYERDLTFMGIKSLKVDEVSHDLQFFEGSANFDYESPNGGETEKILVDGKEFEIYVN